MVVATLEIIWGSLIGGRQRAVIKTSDWRRELTCRGSGVLHVHLEFANYVNKSFYTSDLKITT